MGLTIVLTRSEGPEPVFSAAEVATWPRGSAEHLRRLGILVATDRAESFACDACGFDHVEPVEWHQIMGLPARVCVRCVEVGIVWLDPADLDRWTVHRPALAQRVAFAVGAVGGVVERVSGRVWKVGTVRVGARAWAAFLAVGLGRSDGAALVAQVPELRAPNALVFVPSVLPPEAVWSADRVPAVVPLCDVLALSPRGLVADRDVLASALPAAEPAKRKRPARVFPAPHGTDWEQVALTVEEHHVRVQVGPIVHRFGFAEAGFEDGRKKGTPDEVWALLSAFARHRGVIGTGDRIRTKPGAMKEKVSTLRDRLRALLALDGNPFHPNRAGQPYRARFTIRGAGPATFPTPPGATWDAITMTETAVGEVEIGVTVETRGAAFARGEGGGGAWEGTTDTGERRSRFGLVDLGLTGPDGIPTPAGEALVTILRAGGRLKRPTDDEALLALGERLTRFFRLTDPPFDFDTKRRQWVARFEATSTVPASAR